MQTYATGALTAKILSQVPWLIHLRDMLISLRVGSYPDGELQLFFLLTLWHTASILWCNSMQVRCSAHLKNKIYPTVAQDCNGTGPAEPVGTSQVHVPLIYTEPETSLCQNSTGPMQAVLSQERHRI